MERKIFTGTIALTASLTLGVTSVQALDYKWSGAVDSDWADAGNWDDVGHSNGGYPDGANDKAIFDADATVVLDANVTIGDLELQNSNTDVALSNSSTRFSLTLDDSNVNQNGKIIIPSGTTFDIGKNVTMISDAANVEHEIGGTMILSFSDAASGSEESRFRVKQNATFGPHSGTYGFVDGTDADSDARLQIDQPLSGAITLINKISVSGAMMIEPFNSAAGESVFKSQVAANVAGSGVVIADLANGVLEMVDGLSVEDQKFGSGFNERFPEWEASGVSSAVLLFNTEVGEGSDPDLVGDFIADDGALIQISANVTTTGSLIEKNGADLCADSGVTFTYSGGSETNTCP